MRDSQNAHIKEKGGKLMDGGNYKRGGRDIKADRVKANKRFYNHINIYCMVHNVLILKPVQLLLWFN